MDWCELNLYMNLCEFIVDVVWITDVLRNPSYPDDILCRTFEHFDSAKIAVSFYFMEYTLNF